MKGAPKRSCCIPFSSHPKFVDRQRFCCCIKRRAVLWFGSKERLKDTVKADFMDVREALMNIYTSRAPTFKISDLLTTTAPRRPNQGKMKGTAKLS